MDGLCELQGLCRVCLRKGAEFADDSAEGPPGGGCIDCRGEGGHITAEKGSECWGGHSGRRKDGLSGLVGNKRRAMGMMLTFIVHVWERAHQSSNDMHSF